jgi:hypothetical protein
MNNSPTVSPTNNNGGNTNSTYYDNILLVGIFINLAISIIMAIKDILTTVKKSSCVRSADGAIEVRVDNSEEKK